jgi:hypothetical protein
MVDRGQMHSVYEALSVCSGALRWLEQQEQERSEWDLYIKLAELGKSLQVFIDARGEGQFSFSQIPEEAVPFCVVCLSTLTSMTRGVIERIKVALDVCSDRFRQQIGLSLEQVGELTDRVEDIMEALEMSLDKDLAATVARAVKYFESTKPSVSEDWRQTLELISH